MADKGAELFSLTPSTNNSPDSLCAQTKTPDPFILYLLYPFLYPFFGPSPKGQGELCLALAIARPRKARTASEDGWLLKAVTLITRLEK